MYIQRALCSLYSLLQCHHDDTARRGTTLPRARLNFIVTACYSSQYHKASSLSRLQHVELSASTRFVRPWPGTGAKKRHFDKHLGWKHLTLTYLHVYDRYVLIIIPLVIRGLSEYRRQSSGMISIISLKLKYSQRAGVSSCHCYHFVLALCSNQFDLKHASQTSCNHFLMEMQWQVGSRVYNQYEIGMLYANQ